MQRAPKFKDVFQQAREVLGKSAILSDRGLIEVEAEQLLLAVYRKMMGTNLSRIDLYSKFNDDFPESAVPRLLELCQSRVQGVPLQHLTGTQVFLDHEYGVGPEVLVPRPETEVLCAAALEEFQSTYPVPKLGLEVGLGSGILSIELLSRFPLLQMIGSELTQGARDQALRNAQRILGEGKEGVERLRIIPVSDPRAVLEPFISIQSQWTEQPDFLISNPPYLEQGDEIDQEVREHEPPQALFAPTDDSLHFYRQIAAQGGQLLKPGGMVFVEIPHERSDRILGLFRDAGWTAKVLKDLTQRDRVLIARWYK